MLRVVGGLDWRLDPLESFSDWTLEITTTHHDETSNDEEYSTVCDDVYEYHVQKCILAVGDRKSEYFEKVFRSCHFEEERKSEMNLDAGAADAIPSVLDYLYGLHRFEITTDNAVELSFLGQLFEMHELQWKANQFWEQDMELFNCHQYYRKAQVYENQTLLRAIESCCVEALDQMIDDAGCAVPIVHMGSPSFWCGVFYAKRRLVGCQALTSIRNSKTIAIICDNNRTEMDPGVFQKLTHEELLSHVHEDTALLFVELESSIVGHADTLSSLQQRCIEALAPNRDIVMSSPEMLSRCSSAFLGELLQWALHWADAEVSTKQRQLQNKDVIIQRVSLEARERLRKPIDRESVTLQNLPAQLDASQTAVNSSLQNLRAQANGLGMGYLFPIATLPPSVLLNCIGYRTASFLQAPLTESPPPPPAPASSHQCT